MRSFFSFYKEEVIYKIISKSEWRKFISKVKKFEEVSDKNPKEEYINVLGFVASLSQKSYKNLSTCETKEKFSTLFIQWINSKLVPGSLFKFSVMLNGQRYNYFENKEHDSEGKYLISFLLLIEITKYLDDINHSFKEYSNYIIAGKHRKIDHWDFNLFNSITIYGNGLNYFLDLNWVDPNELESIVDRGIFRNFGKESDLPYEYKIVADSIYFYQATNLKKNSELNNHLEINFLRKTINYETKMLIEYFNGVKQWNNFKEEMEFYIKSAYQHVGKTKIQNFDITKEASLYKIFVYSKILATTNYDHIYWKDPHIKEVVHLHGEANKKMIMSHYIDKMKNIDLFVGHDFWNIENCILIGWSGEHDPHINMIINGNTNIKEILIFDKAVTDSFEEFFQYNRFKTIFPNKRITVMPIEKISEFIKPYERKVEKTKNWESFIKKRNNIENNV